MTDETSVASLLARGREDAIALSAPGPSRPLRYRDLRAMARRTAETLNSVGIGRNDRVAIVLPNGPEMAASFVCVAAGAAAAPLNPACSAEDQEFHLSDLRARAIVLEAGADSPARAAARKLAIPVLDLEREGAEGPFAIRARGVARGAPARPGPSGPEDVALVLHTSGTTSRPKIVPLLQRNVVASALNIAEALSLAPDDVCLNVMPLFHIHGLVGATLSSLAAGARVSCTPGFNALKFFGWLDEVRPTWTTAVPTMYQAILPRARRNREIAARSRLRFIRSCSAPLPPRVMAEREETFGTPVIESYGMTEAAHQMASTPLPPRQRKPGSVGIACGPEIAIIDERGRPLPHGHTGEVAIRGPGVMPGYEANPEANAASFTAGWFRTGDQGVIDADGYLWLQGRIKEIINRGGEKFSPLEVDQVLMHHPAVEQVVTFPVPHPKLGEDVAAAVVLREGETASDQDLRSFAEARLLHFKVPRKILIVREIPKGATAKLQRIGLAARLGLAS